MGPFGSVKRSRDAAAVITGAGSGIGAAFAVELAKRGSRVVCSDIDENAARATADAIIAAGSQATALCCDVSQLDDVKLLATQAQDWFGGPSTMVINNAGVGAGGLPIGELSLDDWNWVLSVNLWGPIHGCHVFAPILKEAGSSGQLGGIINVASAAAFGAAPGMAAYNVSKAGVARMCLDTLDRGGLYCMPQPDARIGWGIKRFTPTVYTRAIGLATRITTP